MDADGQATYDLVTGVAWDFIAWSDTLEREAALAEVYESSPLGSSVLPMPEQPDVDLETIARGFRGARGRVLFIVTPRLD